MDLAENRFGKTWKHFLESSGSTFVGTGDFQFPTFRFAVFAEE